MRLERVWGILQMPVTAKLDWVIRYTGPEAADMFEPALQAFEQAAAAVLERERYHSSTPFAGCLSDLTALLLSHSLNAALSHELLVLRRACQQGRALQQHVCMLHLAVEN